MLPTIDRKNPRTGLESAMVAALREMSTQGYTEPAQQQYARVWRHLLVFARNNGKSEMSPELGHDFLTSFRSTPAAFRCCGMSSSVIEMRAIRALEYFVSHGVWDGYHARRRQGRKVPHVPPIMDCDSPSTPLESAMVDALRTMKRLGYEDSSRYRYSSVWKSLLEFAKRNGKSQMSVELGEIFLKAYQAAGRCTKHRKAFGRRAVGSLLRFVSHGTWEPVQSRREAPVLLDPFRNAHRAYVDYLKNERHVSKFTLIAHGRHAESFLAFLQNNGLTHLTTMTAPLLARFLSEKTDMSSRSLEAISLALRSFLRFLFVGGTLNRDWSLMIPHFHRHSVQLPPAIWTENMVDSMLGSIDRSCPRGKRDYAMLLLACRLGMRAGEIRMLCLESLRWDDIRIEYVQSKTGVKVIFPLTDEIAHSLIDYLLHGRPSTDRREVFLRLRAPYRPLDYSWGHVIKRYRPPDKMAFLGQHAGMQSLRHTVATRLLREGVPLETIATILGHSSLNTTRVYTKVDISQLLTAALDTEELCHA